MHWIVSICLSGTIRATSSSIHKQCKIKCGWFSRNLAQKLFVTFYLMPGVNWETCTIQLGEKGQSMSVTKLPHIINYKKYSLPPMLKSFIFEPKVVERVCATDSGRWVAGYRRRPDFSSSRQSVDTLQSTRNLYWWVAWSWLLLLTYWPCLDPSFPFLSCL